MQDLLTMICTRICHDVINSSQSILQGVESLDDEDATFVEQSKVFIKEGAESLNGKLMFFRALCGRPGKLATVSDVKEIGGFYLNITNRRVYEIETEISGECDDISLLKCGLALCCMATDILIRGGKVSLNYDGNMLVCKMQGYRLKLSEEFKSILQRQDVIKLDPKTAIAGYLMDILNGAERALSLDSQEDEVKILIK